MEIQKHNYQYKGKLAKRKVTKEIILHCTATKEGIDYTALTIHEWHLQRGFSGIGYHYLIYRDGSVHEGRPVDCIGAHCTGHNSVSIGICYVGGLDMSGTPKDTRTDKQKQAMYQLVEKLTKQFKLTINNVRAHNEYAAKACPSFGIDKFKAEYESYLNCQ